jgi:hypothetical protein
MVNCSGVLGTTATACFSIKHDHSYSIEPLLLHTAQLQHTQVLHAYVICNPNYYTYIYHLLHRCARYKMTSTLTPLH